MTVSRTPAYIHPITHQPDYTLDNTMVLLIGLKPDQCDWKQIMILCDKEIGVTQLVTIKSVDCVDMSKEYIKLYKEDGCDSCAVVLFRTYTKNQLNYELQTKLLQNGITHITLENVTYLVTYKQGYAW
jgi:hypothetical protein